MGFPLRKVAAFAASTATSLTAARVFTEEPWSLGSIIKSFTGGFLTASVGWVFYAVILWPYFLSPLRHLPGPKDGHWLLGQYPRIIKQPTGVPQIDWVNNIPNDGLIRYCGLLNQERLLINSPKALSEVLVTKNYDFIKPSSIRWSIGRILGIGVLLAEGDDHKFQRKHLMPAFAFRHVKDLYPVFWSKAAEGVEAMTESILREASTGAAKEKETAKDTAVIEAGQWASRITLDIIGVAGLGRDFNAIKDPNSPLAKTYQQVFKPSKQAQILGLLSLILPGPLVTALPVKRNEDVAQAARVIRATCRDLIGEKKRKLERKETADLDILSVALESGAFTDENLVDQMMTFLAAGHETTASSMQWAIYMMCLHPDVQARLRDEVRARLPPPTSGAAIAAPDIDRMPYLNAVCSEVLRYYAPVPITLRETAVDTTVLGQAVPRGTRIMLCPWATNKDTAQWGPDAERFRPDRWLSPEGVNASGGASSNFAFMTFLHGPRSCIGQGFAKAEFACILATWVGRFEFSLRDEELLDETKVEIKGGVTARPAKGLHVHARVVEGW